MNEKTIFLNLYSIMKNNEFKGYDPYDYMSSPYTNKENAFFSIIGTQFLKYSPINFRSYLQIEKKHNLKTLILTARSIIRYLQVYGVEKNLENDMKNNVELILHHAKKNNGMSWSRIDYDFYSTSGYQNRDSSIIYLTSLVGHLFIDLFEFYKDKKYLEISDQIGRFLTSIEIYSNDDELCFYYTTSLKNKIFNASACASAFLSRLYRHTKDEKYLLVSQKGFNYIIKNQNHDGSWYYGFDENDKQLKLIDYHQGFILDAISTYLNNINFDKTYYNSYVNGLEFYKNKQFMPNGRSIYRYPRKWPADIHNQAQGILTFSIAGEHKPDYKKFAEIIIQWTINNMKDKADFFYYQKWPFMINKINYMRWSQAWMLFALSEYLSHIKNEEKK